MAAWPHDRVREPRGARGGVRPGSRPRVASAAGRPGAKGLAAGMAPGWAPSSLSSPGRGGSCVMNEYKYFQRMTSTSRVEGKQNALIMGKKTWFSIPEKNRPLKDRINIVLSRELKEPPKGAHYLSKSLDDALALLDSPELKSKVDMVWIVGGTSVYKAAMEKPINHRLFVTRILQEFESDTFFPEIDQKDYKLLTEYPGVPTDIQEENGIQYKFEIIPSLFA
ncbi:dihydrofolate reductase isoform 2-T2 [Chlamydotis macqueenii]